MKDWEGRQDRQKRWTYRREMDAEVVVKGNTMEQHMRMKKCYNTNEH